MINMDNKTYAREYTQTRGLKETTYTKLALMLDHYSAFQQMSIHELLLEADDEEEQGIRWKRRTLKKSTVR